MRLIICLLLLLSACTSMKKSDSDTLIGLQIIDRNGFSETINSDERLSKFKNTDFLDAQPYQKVQCHFGKDEAGKSFSQITSYHPNGQLWQYLEVENGRAKGLYREWHESGQLKVEISVIEGVADITPMAQASWLFDGHSQVWDENGNLVAEIGYDKGSLEGHSLYYHSNHTIAQSIPYHRNKIDGEVTAFDEEGKLREKSSYKEGLKEGISLAYWKEDQLAYEETYKEGLLQKGHYHLADGTLSSAIVEGAGIQTLFENQRLFSLIEYKKGVPEGEVKIFDQKGDLTTLYHIKNDKKNGEEWEYYSGGQDPKLYLFWKDDLIQGVVKTWYENGTLESQKEMNRNKKQGLSFGWFQDGSLMLMEEYDDDLLVKGSYFKKGDSFAVSKVENGTGIVTLFDSEGHFLQKVNYDKGNPALD